MTKALLFRRKIFISRTYDTKSRGEISEREKNKERGVRSNFNCN